MLDVRALASGAVDLYLRSRVLRALAILVLAYLTYGFLLGFPGVDDWIPYRIDFDVYRIGGQVFRDGGDLYGTMPDTLIGANLPFTYPPIAAALFSLFTYVPWRVGSVTLSALSVAAMLVVAWLIIREFGRSKRDAAWLMVLVGSPMIWIHAQRETIEFGQVNTILMALVVVDLLVGRGKRWQGVLVGFAMSIKLTPAVFLAYFLMRRDWRALFVSAGSALGFVALGFLLAPRDSVVYWTSALRDPRRIGEIAFPSNQSLNGMLHRSSLPEEWTTVVWFLLCAAIGLATLALLRRLFRYGHDAMAGVVMGLYALIASPISWGHHWVWAAPAILILGVWAWRLRPAWASALLVAFGAVGAWVFLYAPHWYFPHPEDENPHWNLGQQLAGSAYLWWVLAALVVAWFVAPHVAESERRGAQPARR